MLSHDDVDVAPEGGTNNDDDDDSLIAFYSRSSQIAPAALWLDICIIYLCSRYSQRSTMDVGR